jgi:D-beta-D-heptose 7-phosphate kinase/D-beta-D-heptose 1-phosphate adenosyltransferase
MFDVSRLTGKKVLVIGDLMLDEFVRGEVLRISPEAPVPVLEVKGRTYRPGGAANAAANVTSLGGRAAILGVAGTDREGDVLVREIGAAGVDASLVVLDGARPTTHKTRIIARGQQVVRIDHESRAPLSDATIGELVARATAALREHDACVLSDYAKGVITPALCSAVIAAARSLGRPVIVDPKRRDFTPYRGATVVTPNLKELEVATGVSAGSDEEVLAASSSVLAQIGETALLVTRGAEGMTLLKAGAPPRHLHATARQVFDVTGAGDTVVGTLALALAAGIALEHAIEAANAAAAVAVGKPGTATVSLNELAAALTDSPSIALPVEGPMRKA